MSLRSLCFSSFTQKAALVPFAVAMLFAVLSSPIAADPANMKDLSAQATPKSLQDYAVFMANGTIPFEPHPNPAITGCGGFIFCDGDYFHRVIMGRDEYETEQESLKARSYFANRFGVDVDNPANVGKIQFFSFYLDPRGNYRVYSMAKEAVPPRGWEIRDGGFAAMVIDPDGFELGGDFAGSGLVMPPEGMLVYGNYNILARPEKPRAHRTIRRNRQIIYSYRSDMPMITNDWGELVVNCQISVDGFLDGELDGKAQGMGLPLVPDQSGFTLSWRNVLTIPKS